MILLFRLFLMYGSIALFIALLFIHFKAKAWQPFTWAFMPGVAANIVFYYVVWRRDAGLFLPPSSEFINTLSTVRITILLVPSLIIVILKIKEILWTGTGHK